MDWLTAVVEFATFVVVLYILYRIAGNAIGRMLSQRSERIGADLRTSEENLRRAAAMQAESQRQIEQAHAEAQGIAESARKAAEAQRQALIAQAEQEAEALVQRTESAIQRERQAAIDELRREAGRLAIVAASQVINNSLDAKTNTRLADDAIADVGKVS